MQKFFLNSIQYKVLKVIPNLLTIFRFFLVYPIVLFILDNNFLWAIFLYILAAITDFFDGLIARKFDLISEFGKIADPISDKTLILGALISLSLNWRDRLNNGFYNFRQRCFCYCWFYFSFSFSKRL